MFAAVAVSGCAVHKPGAQTWRLARQGTGEILIPPGASNRDFSHRTFRADVPATASCAGTEGVTAIKPRGKKLAVTVFPAALAAKPQGWLSEWATGLETRACIPAGAAAVLAAQIVDSVPLDLNASTRLLHPNDRQTGQVDLQPGMRLEVISPIVKDGAAPDAPIITSNEPGKITVTVSSSNLVGYEVAWFGVAAASGGNMATIVPDYAERHIDGRTERASAANSLRFPALPGYYRLFYKSGSTDFTAILLGASTWPDLERSSKALNEDSCRAVKSATCVLVPKRIAINPMLSVTVNGKAENAGWGSTVGGVIQHAGFKRPADTLPQLSVMRPYKGGSVPVVFDRRDPSILNMVLTGGEVISTGSDSAPPR